MIKSQNNKHVRYVLPGEAVEGKTMKGGWHYFDEAGLLGNSVPFATEKEAAEKLEEYARRLAEGPG